MTPPQARHAPGWYPDLDDPGALRYFDGAAWTARRRPKPSFAAIEPIDLGPRSAPVRLRRRRLRALTWVLVAALVSAGVAGIRLLVGGSASTGDRPVAPIVTDAAWLAGANARCAAALDPLRPIPSATGSSAPGTRDQPALTPAGTQPNRTPTLDPLDPALAAAIEHLAAALPEVQVEPGQAGSVETWLDNWRRLATLARSGAHGWDAGRVHTFGAVVAAVNAFAGRNGVDACLL